MIPTLGPAARSVMVCDDSQALRDSLRVLLENLPRFRAAGDVIDGASCLRALAADPPDILILDVSMPGGGADLVRAARAACPTMRIVMHSGRADASTQRRMLAVGADAYVVKAGRLALLLQALDGPAHIPAAPAAPEMVHTAQFLPDDRAWMIAFVQFARSALAGDGRLVVAASAAHLAALQVALPGGLASAEDEGRLLMHGAEETLSLLIPGGRIDEGYFHHELAPAVQEFSTGHGAVSLWGEMAGLTWATGNVVGALALETLWNNIDIDGPLIMMCPYPATIDRPVTGGELAVLQRLHSIDNTERDTPCGNVPFG